MAYYERIEDIDEKITYYYKKDAKPWVGLGVVIKNSSHYDLEYVNSGIETGFNVKPIKNMFIKEGATGKIRPGYAGGLMWDRHGGGEFGMFFVCLKFSNYLIYI